MCGDVCEMLFLSIVKDCMIVVIFILICILEAKIIKSKSTLIASIIPVIFFIISMYPNYLTIRNLFYLKRLTSVAPFLSLSCFVILIEFILIKIKLRLDKRKDYDLGKK